MTDAERADAWLIPWLDWLPAAERDAFTRDLAEQFAAVRADERAALGAYVRGLAAQKRPLAESRLLQGLAWNVEHAKHAPARPATVARSGHTRDNTGPRRRGV